MAPDLDNIIAQIYTDHRVQDFIRKVDPPSLAEDLRQHAILQLCEIASRDPDKIRTLAIAGQIWPYYVGIMRLQLKSTKSTFYTLFRRQFDDLPTHSNYIPDEHSHTYSVDEVNNRMRELGMQNAQLAKPKVARIDCQQLGLFM